MRAGPYEIVSPDSDSSDDTSPVANLGIQKFQGLFQKDMSAHIDWTAETDDDNETEEAIDVSVSPMKKHAELQSFDNPIILPLLLTAHEECPELIKKRLPQDIFKNAWHIIDTQSNPEDILADCGGS